MSEGLLVFASKRVGLALLGYLFEVGAPVGRVICSPADDAIVALAAQRGLAASAGSPELLSSLPAEGERYAWLLNLWSSLVLPPAVLALAERHLNIHPSLVPHFRGSDSATWTIRRGAPAGVSLIGMTAALDGGDVYVQEEVPYRFGTNGRELHGMLQDRAIDLFRRSWPAIAAGQMEPRPQGSGGSTHRRRDTVADRVREADEAPWLTEAVRWVLAHDFWPDTTAEVRCSGRRYRLRLTVEEC